MKNGNLRAPSQTCCGLPQPCFSSSRSSGKEPASQDPPQTPPHPPTNRNKQSITHSPTDQVGQAQSRSIASHLALPVERVKILVHRLAPPTPTTSRSSSRNGVERRGWHQLGLTRVGWQAGRNMAQQVGDLLLISSAARVVAATIIHRSLDGSTKLKVSWNKRSRSLLSPPS